jgi:hypothetical protein
VKKNEEKMKKKEEEISDGGVGHQMKQHSQNL